MSHGIPGSGNRASDFLADKDVNLVQPVGGAGSCYSDWWEPDPRHGVLKRKSILAEELRPLIDCQLGTNGVNGIAGGPPVLAYGLG